MQLLTNPCLESCFKIAGLSCRISRRSQFVFHILFSHLQWWRSKISISALQEHKAAVKMLFATIPKVPLTVQINLDILEMVAKINVTKALILF